MGTGKVGQFGMGWGVGVLYGVPCFFFWFKFSFSEIYIGYFLFIYFLFCRSGGVLIFCGFARRWTGGGKWELFLSYIRGFFF